MITQEQRERRKTGIFSSDVPRIMDGDGVLVALEKMGAEAEDNLDDVIEVEIGSLIEPAILDAYAEQDKVDFIRSPDTMRHPVHQWLGAHLDGLWPNFLDIDSKAVGWYRRHLWGDGGDEVPDDVLWQVQEQMLVVGVPLAKVPVCFINEESLKHLLLWMRDVSLGQPPKLPPITVFTIPADEELQSIIIEKAGYVWHCVQAMEYPLPEKPSDIRLIYKKDNGYAVEATDDIVALHSRLMQVRNNKSAFEKEEKAIKFEIQKFMADYSEIRYQGRTLATFKKAKDGEAFDEASFAKAHPDLYKQFLVPTTGSRRFLPKDVL